MSAVSLMLSALKGKIFASLCCKIIERRGIIEVDYILLLEFILFHILGPDLFGYLNITLMLNYKHRSSYMYFSEVTLMLKIMQVLKFLAQSEL